MQQTSQRVLKLSGALFALIVLLTFNVSTTHAVTNPCSTTASVTSTSGAAGSCYIGFNLVPNTGILSYTADPNLTITSGSGTNPGTIIGGTGKSDNPYRFTLNGVNQTFGISFTTTVTDDRGDTPGWSLAASTPTSTGTPSISLDSLTPTCTGSCFPAPGSLSTATLPLTLTNSAQQFVGAIAATGTNTNHGIYTIVTSGTLTIPSSASAGTAITGNLTLTLNNANFSA